jgi:hypothetical protein
MANFTALEVVIGLAFVYFVLALICSAVAETVSSLQRKRAKMLVTGIENLFSGSNTITREGQDLARLFWNHPLVQGLIRPRGGSASSAAAESNGQTSASQADGKGPAYIPARTFVTALIDLGARNTHSARQAAVDAEALAEVLTNTKLVDAINGIQSAPLRQALLAIYAEAGGDFKAFRQGAEKWYDDAMDRVSGWYKRHIQLVLWIIAIVVVVVLNVDTVQIATTLWKDPTTRAAVVARADQAVKQHPTSVNVSQAVNTIGLPLGWKLKLGKGQQDIPNQWRLILSKLVGLLLTAAALSLGAPFWFDLLSKFVRVRGTGPPPSPSPSPAGGKSTS